MGHALGLFGHSPSPIDIVYPKLHEIGLEPSQSDLETIHRLYRRQPAAQIRCVRVGLRCDPDED